MYYQGGCEIKCFNCGEWFLSGIHYQDAESFFNSTQVGTPQKCPCCKKMTSCNREYNMRFVQIMPDGSARIIEGKESQQLPIE